ncbi:hypothetical protein ACIQXW_12785 [Lysinibacillus sp. NPDC097162]|uniref:hypothetical protein n=1 Tax=unclassified Lysinibacillus TaxID=2636778 RepID=UPI0037FDEA4E
MWKMSFLTIILATVFLGGCNWGNNAANETPMENVKNDVRKGVNDVEDVVDPNKNHDVYDRNVNNNTRGTVNEGRVNEGTVNENTVMPEATTPGSNADVNGSNGYDNVPNANGVNGVERNNNAVNERNTMTTP